MAHNVRTTGAGNEISPLASHVSELAKDRGGGGGEEEMKLDRKSQISLKPKSRTPKSSSELQEEVRRSACEPYERGGRNGGKENSLINRRREWAMNPQFQVSKCANPACAETFLRLSRGRLFIFGVPAKKGGPKKQILWLCASCSQTLTLKRSINSSIELVETAKTASVAA